MMFLSAGGWQDFLLCYSHATPEFGNENSAPLYSLSQYGALEGFPVRQPDQVVTAKVQELRARIRESKQ
jgi:hypothetical protein